MFRSSFAAPAAVLLLAVAGCEHTQPTAPTTTRGALLDSAYLAILDSAQLPCCAVDSAGVHITTVAGALTFYRLVDYTDSVLTPSGMAPAPCVSEVPSGATVIGRAGLVVFPDGSIHLFLGCSVGTFVLTVTRRLSYPDGSTRTGLDVLAAGTYYQAQDTVTLVKSLSLVDTLAAAPLAATLSDTTITVVSPAHRYAFEVPCGDFCAAANRSN